NNFTGNWQSIPSFIGITPRSGKHQQQCPREIPSDAIHLSNCQKLHQHWPLCSAQLLRCQNLQTNIVRHWTHQRDSDLYANPSHDQLVLTRDCPAKTIQACRQYQFTLLDSNVLEFPFSNPSTKPTE